MAELGQHLQEARARRGLTVEDVASGTRIRPDYIRALEEERFGDLPAPVYVRGFLRNYATFLGLDADELIAELESGGNGKYLAPRRPSPPQLSAPVWRGPSPRALVGAALLVVVVAFVVYIFHQYSAFAASRSTNVFAAPSATPAALPATAAPIPTVTAIPTAPPSPTAIVVVAATPPPVQRPVAAAPSATAAPPPAPTATPKASPTPAAPIVLSLHLLSASWLRVTVDGQVKFEGTLQPGTTRSWNGAQFITVRFGNAGGVDATFNGKAEGVVGTPGEVVERTYRLG